MKKIALICAAVAAVVLLSSAKKKDNVMVKENGTYIIDTTELGKQVDGYVGPTPLKVYIRKNKIEKIEFLSNQETPKYWNACKKHMQNKWDGMKVSEAKTAEVDGRTGATFSSDAVKKNVSVCPGRVGFRYFAGTPPHIS